MKIVKDPCSGEYVVVDMEIVWQSWRALSEVYINVKKRPGNQNLPHHKCKDGQKLDMIIEKLDYLNAVITQAQDTPEFTFTDGFGC